MNIAISNYLVGGSGYGLQPIVEGETVTGVTVDKGSCVIPEGVTIIDQSAFYLCTALKDINFPDSLIEIKKVAFSNCYNLEAISLPENLTTMDYNCFYNCTSLGSITINKNTPYFYREMFTFGNTVPRYDKLKILNIPNGWIPKKDYNGGYDVMLAFTGLDIETITNCVNNLGMWSGNNCTVYLSSNIKNQSSSIEGILTSKGYKFDYIISF